MQVLFVNWVVCFNPEICIPYQTKIKCMKFNYPFAAAIALMLSCAGGYAQQEKTAGYYKYNNSCLSSELDGSVTILGWGAGRNRFDALEQAKKNVLNDVLFVGILEGQLTCWPKPLINTPNARSMYRPFFDLFFNDKNGNWRKYVSSADEQLVNKQVRDKKETQRGVLMSAVVRVNIPALRKLLEEEGILLKP